MEAVRHGNDISKHLDPEIVADALRRMSQQTTHKISNAGMEKEPQSVNFRGHSATMPRSKSADSLTAFRRQDAIIDVDLESLANSSVMGPHGHPTHKKKLTLGTESGPRMEPNLLLPYVSSALDLAEEKIGDRASLQRVSVVGDHSSLKKSSVIRTASLGQQLSEQSRKSSGNQTEGSGEITDISGRKSSSIGGIANAVRMFKRKRPGLSGDSTDRIVFSFKAHESGDSPSTTLSQMTSVASSTMSPPISPPTSQSPINLPKISITHTTETDCHDNVKQSDEEEDSKRERLISGSSEQLDLPVEASPEYIFDQEKKMSSASSGQTNTNTICQDAYQPYIFEQQLDRNGYVSSLTLPAVGETDDDIDTKSIRSLRSSIRSLSGLPGEFTASGTADPSSVTQNTADENKEIEAEELRSARLWDSCTMILPVVWCVLLVIFGIVANMFDIYYVPSTPSLNRVGEGFNIFLSILGSFWLLFLLVDISRYISTMKEYWEKGKSPPEIEFVKNDDGELLISIPLAPEKIPQYYGFSGGRHAGSNFLKVAAAFFCTGHVVHMCLIIAKNATLLSEEELKDYIYDCKSRTTIAGNFFHIIYVALQVYIMFKYSNVIVNRKKELARFAFMHCIASSIVFWVSCIINEIMDELTSKLSHKDDDHYQYGASGLGTCPELNASCPLNYPKNNDIGPFINMDLTCVECIMCQCNSASQMAQDVFNITPYLYPFSIEFSILVVGVWYVMWDNIGKVAENRKTGIHFLPERRESIDSATGTPSNRAMEIYANCQSATKGMLAGLLTLALMLVGMFVYTSESSANPKLSITVYTWFVSAMLVLMILATGWVFYHLSKFDVNPNPISFLDDMLLLICLPAIFLYCFLTIWPVFSGHAQDSAANIITSLLTLIQVILQTLTIVDGLRRCSNSEKNQVERRAKNSLTFLIVTNLTMYIWETLETKNHGGQFKSQAHFYGDNVWVVLNHLTQPLSIFYRFHSAVALADIWNSAYSPGDYH